MTLTLACSKPSCWLPVLLVFLVACTTPAAAAGRLEPELPLGATREDDAPRLLDLAAAAHQPGEAAHHLSPRRLLVERRTGGTDATLAVDPTPEAAIVALALRFRADALLEGLADAHGFSMVPDYQARALAVDALVSGAKAVAAHAIAAARAGLHQLDAALRTALPPRSDAAAMEALLLDAGFQERLKDTRVEGLLLVTTALQPHLPAFAARARAALAPLVEPPGGLPPLSDFSASFLADITPALASSIVENTLLQSLWQD